MADSLTDTLNGLFGTDYTSQGPDSAPVNPPGGVIAPAHSSTPVTNPDASGARLSKSTSDAEAAAASANEFVQSLIPKLDATNQIKNNLLAEKVASQKPILDEVSQQTDAYQAAVTPLFARARAIADKQAAIAGANPIVQGIKAIFNPAENPNWLAKQADATGGQIRAMTQGYQSGVQTSDQVIRNLDNKYTLSTSMMDTMTAEDVEKARAKLQGVTTANQVVGSQLQTLQANSEALAASHAARTDMLGSMTLADINKGLADAQAHGGTATINGMQVQAGELQQYQNQWQQKNLSLESMKLSVQANRLDLAKAQEANLISHMSGPDLHQALTAGGKWNGVQLNQEQLTQAYGSMLQRTQAQAEEASQPGSVATYASMIRDIGTTNTNMALKSTNMFGVLPPEILQNSHQVATALSQIGEGYKTAIGQGVDVARKYITDNLPKIQAIRNAQDTALQTLAKKWSGGDKNLEAYSYGYMSGNPVNAKTSAAALITMARDGIPAGFKPSPDSVAQIEAIKPIIQQYYAGSSGTDINSILNRQKPKDRKGEVPDELISQVNAKIQGGFNNSAMNTSLQTAPLIARQIIGPDGQPSPASRIDPRDIAGAKHMGDQQAIESAARNAGINATQLQQILNGGPSGDAYKTYAQQHKTGAQDYGTLSRNVMAGQTAFMLSNLDASPSGQQPGFQPSKALADLFSDPQFQQHSMNLSQAIGQQNPGDFLIHNIAGGTYGQSLLGYSNVLNTAVAANHAQTIAGSVALAKRAAFTNPVAAATAALSTIDGMTPSDSKQLMAAVVPLAQQSKVPINEGISNVIMNQKFSDPGLESIRRKAARDWPAQKQALDKSLQAYSDFYYSGYGQGAF